MILILYLATAYALKFVTPAIETYSCSTVPADATPPTSCVTDLNLDINTEGTASNVECIVTSGLGYLIKPSAATGGTITYTTDSEYSERYKIVGTASQVTTFMGTIGFSPKYFYSKDPSPYSKVTFNEWDYVEATCNIVSSITDAVSTSRLVEIGSSNL